MAESRINAPLDNDIIKGIEGVQVWATHTLSFGFARENDARDVNHTLERYGSTGEFNPFGNKDPVDLQFENDFLLCMNAYSHICDLTFVEAPRFGEADLKYAGFDNLDGGFTAGESNFPGYYHKRGGGSEVSLFINSNGGGNDVPLELGGSNWAISTIIHEMGHTLGLGHPHDHGDGTTVWTSVKITSHDDPLDNERYTVMSYEGGGLDTSRALPGGSAVTPMALDVAAMQHIYGAVDAYTGDTTYIMTDRESSPIDLAGDDGTISIGRAFYCIWDTGGNDTIRYDGEQNALIDLNAATLVRSDDPATAAWIAELSTLPGFAGLPHELKDDISNPAYHAGGFFSRLYQHGVQLGGYSIANGVTIENGTGGAGNDLLIGNDAANHLSGNDGRDVLVGNGGADVLDGGAAEDIFVYAAYTDSANHKYDTINAFNADKDKIDLWFTIGGVDTTLSANRFGGIDKAADAAHFETGDAVLVTVGPATYLLVDANGHAGYQAGEDLIVRMDGVSALDAGAFI